MSTTLNHQQLSLPPYVYGRECGADEKVWPESAVREAQRLAIESVTTATAQHPILTVDAVLLTMSGGGLSVGLVRRDDPADPEAGKFSLPSASVGLADEGSATELIVQLLKDKYDVRPSYVEQSFTEAGPHRDSRGWSSSVVHLALQPLKALMPAVGAGQLSLFRVWPEVELPEAIAQDHRALIQATVERLVAKAASTTLVAHLLPKVFPLSDLLDAYQVVCQRSGNSANFRRKILINDVLAEDESLHSIGRPAMGYKLKRKFAQFAKNII